MSLAASPGMSSLEMPPPKRPRLEDRADCTTSHPESSLQEGRVRSDSWWAVLNFLYKDEMELMKEAFDANKSLQISPAKEEAVDDEFSERFSRVYEKGDNAHADTQGPAAGFYTPVPIIHNLVCTSALHCSKTPIDLDYICSKLPNSFYDRKRFAATTIRLVDPVCTGLLFSSGKLVLTGCKSHKQAVLATLKITRLLNVFTDGCTFQLCDGVQVQNVVGHSDLMLKPWQTLDIKRFYDDNQSVCTYQKSLFPGLILRVPGSPVVILCFLSGRIVVTGGKQEIDILSGFKPLYAMLRKYIC